MNPWAIIILLLAAGCLIVAYKGTQDNVFSALAGKKIGNPNISNSAQGSSSLFGIIPLSNPVAGSTPTVNFA